jgi:hypothetical protein
MMPLPSRRPPEEREKLREWLNTDFAFTHFITLATNQTSKELKTRNRIAGHDSWFRYTKLRDLLRQWDARVNRELNGPKWLAHADDAIWYFAFLEKPEANPHWHLLFRINFFTTILPHPKLDCLTIAATAHWQRLVPSGTVSVKEINARHDRVTDYVAKELGHEVQYESWIVPDDFRVR